MSEINTSNTNLTKKGVDLKESNRILYISGAIIAILVIGLITNGYGLFNKRNNSNDKVKLTIGNAPVLGEEIAPITIYEFSDFSCPYCAAASGYNIEVISQLTAKNPDWEAPLPAIKEEFVDSGKAKLVFKYASGHGTGQSAHLVAWCLNDQDLFWQFHDLAFKNQKDVSSIEKMRSLAEEIGANMTLLESCLGSKKYNYLLESDNDLASSNGVTGTPTFFINGRKIEGAASFYAFKKIIEQELAKQQ